METSGVPARARATFGSPDVESKVKLGFRHLLEIVNEKSGEPVNLVLRNIHHKKGKKNRNFVFERRLAKMAPSDEISIKKRAAEKAAEVSAAAAQNLQAQALAAQRV